MERKERAHTQVPQGTVRAETGGVLTMCPNRNGQGAGGALWENSTAQCSDIGPGHSGLPLKERWCWETIPDSK